jgi:hypothetical protein
MLCQYVALSQIKWSAQRLQTVSSVHVLASQKIVLFQFCVRKVHHTGEWEYLIVLENRIRVRKELLCTQSN